MGCRDEWGTYVGEGIEFLGHGHGDLIAEVGEANLNELLGVDRSVEVTALSDVSRELHTSSVGGLPNVQAVHSAGHLADQNGRQALSSQLLVYAEEVDLGHAHRLVVDVRGDRDAGDETNEQLVACGADSNVPVLLISRRSQCPEVSKR